VTLIETPPEHTPPEHDQRDSVAVDRTIRAAGLLIAVLATVVTAVAELYLTPLRIGGVPIGVAVLFAAAANWGLAWYAEHATGRRWPIALPWALWTLLMLFAAGVRTTEGDYLLGGDDWVALVMILVGSLTFAVYAYRAILRRNIVNPAARPAELRDHPPADR
jgi:hypothetical protein